MMHTRYMSSLHRPSAAEMRERIIRHGYPGVSKNGYQHRLLGIIQQSERSNGGHEDDDEDDDDDDDDDEVPASARTSQHRANLET